MARRSSARLRGRNSSTPKRLSLSHDAPVRTPRTAPVKLSTLREDGDMPGAFPSSVSPSPRTSLEYVNNPTTTGPVKFNDSTPKNLTPIKPTEEEMHPKQYQQSTAKPLEEARWLGFSNVAPRTEPAMPKSSIPLLQGTPTRTSKPGKDVNSPKFRFTFGREQSLELSPAARKLMDEKREEAARIRELMVANGEGGETIKEAVQRKIAKPKSKKGRFSEVHMEQFKKMDSIAKHAPTSRPAFNAPKFQSTASEMSPSKGLKRKASKAQLDEGNASSTFDSPTQTSLARKSSSKSFNTTKIPAPALARSPSKPSMFEQDAPLLSRSPAKASLFTRPATEKATSPTEQLFKRSPVKGLIVENGPKPENVAERQDKVIRLLSHSPLKMSVLAKDTAHEVTEEKPTSSVPLLSMSPSKIALPDNSLEPQPAETPTKATGSNIKGRFNLLRSSPIKSILRSPQRLYSNDPAKVAAGTHLASPASVAMSNKKVLTGFKEGTPSIEKHVDFTSSTKARYERAQSESSSTPAKRPKSPSKQNDDINQTSATGPVQYPSLPSNSNDTEMTPQKRRQTAAPYDFTFTSHGSGIVFGQSPNAPKSAANSRSPSTIRHVSAEPQFPPAPPASAGSKKRKFDFENDKVADDKKSDPVSDKENVGEVEEERPSKRVKPNLPEPPATKPATRLPTLGVRPKKTDNTSASGKPKTISRARLNALAQPKRRA